MLLIAECIDVNIRIKYLYDTTYLILELSYIEFCIPIIKNEISENYINEFNKDIIVIINNFKNTLKNGIKYVNCPIMNLLTICF